ncbi:MAG: thioredoxin family protein [Bacteroidota bacterium]
MAATAVSTTHFDPLLAGRDRSSDWEQGISFETFLPTAEKNEGLWRSGWERTRIPDEMLERAAHVAGHWKLLVLSADWCGDASNTVPVLARLAGQTEGLELRLLERDDHLDLMDEHLTGGTARSIPAVILLDGENKEHAWWGPRPADLQAWVKTVGLTMETGPRYKEVRKWYARDKGRTTLHELLSMIERASGGTHVA